MAHESEGMDSVGKAAKAFPHVSIVTINFNMAAGLERTIASVAAQDFASREYIVVDGGSSDASHDLICQNSALITRSVSERDDGIYDAMNKGVAMARGHWILFLNSGDIFAGNDVLSKIFSAEYPNDAIIYGDARMHYDTGAIRLAPAADTSSLPYGMICSHQALFARRALLLELPFTLGKIRSDYEFLLSCWKAGRQFHRVNVLIADVEAGGLSDRKRIPALYERAVLLHRENLLGIAVLVNLFFGFFWAVTAPAVKIILPAPLSDALRKLKQAILGAGSARG